MRLHKLALAVIALALFTADATAGPLQRLRARRSGGCSAGTCGAAGASYGHAIPAPIYAGSPLVLAGGCPGGNCPLR